MNTKLKKRLATTFAILIPSAVVGGVMSTMIKTEQPTIDINDPNRKIQDGNTDKQNPDFVLATKKAISRLDSKEDISEKRLNIEYKFDSSFKARTVATPETAVSTIKDTQVKTLQTADEKFKSLVNEFLSHGMDVNDLTLMLTIFRVDYEDSFNFDTRSWTDFLARKYGFVKPDWYKGLRTLRYMKALFRFYNLAHSGLDVYYKLNFGNELYKSAKKILKRHKSVKKKVMPQIRKKISSTYKSSLRKPTLSWRSSQIGVGYDEVDSINPFNLTEMLKSLSLDEVDNTEKLKSLYGEWFDSKEGKAYAKAAGERRYSKETGIFFDPNRKPPTIADFVEANDVIDRITKGDPDALDAVLSEIGSEQASAESRKIFAIENRGFNVRTGKPDLHSVSLTQDQIAEQIRNLQKNFQLGTSAGSLSQISSNVKMPKWMKTSGLFNDLYDENRIAAPLAAIESIKKDVESIKLSVKTETIPDDGFNPTEAVKQHPQLSKVQPNADFERRLKNIQNNRLTDAARVTYHNLDNGLNYKRVDRTIDTILEGIISGEDLDRLEKEAIKRLRDADAKGIKLPLSKTEMVADVKHFFGTYRTQVKKLYEQKLSALNKMKQLQFLYERAQRRDKIFLRYAQIKQGIKRAKNEAEVAAVFNKYLADISIDDLDVEKVDVERAENNFDYKTRVDNYIENSEAALKEAKQPHVFKDIQQVDANEIRKLNDNLTNMMTTLTDTVSNFSNTIAHFADALTIEGQKIKRIISDYNNARKQLSAMRGKEIKTKLEYDKLKEMIKKQTFDKIMDDPHHKKFLEHFYDNGITPQSKRLADLSDINELIEAFNIAAANADYAIEKVNEAGQTIVKRFRDLSSDKVHAAQTTMDLLNQMMDSPTALKRAGLVAGDIIDVHNSAEGEDFVELLGRSFDEVSEAYDEMALLQGAFTKNILEPSVNIMQDLVTDPDIKNAALSMLNAQSNLITSNPAELQQNLQKIYSKIVIKQEKKLAALPSPFDDISPALRDTIDDVKADLLRANAKVSKILEDFDDQLENIEKFKKKFSKLKKKGAPDKGKEFLKVDLNTDLGKLLQKQTEKAANFITDPEYVKKIKDEAQYGYFTLATVEHAETELKSTKDYIQHTYHEAFTPDGRLSESSRLLSKITDEFEQRYAKVEQLASTTFANDPAKIKEYAKELTLLKQSLEDYEEVLSNHEQIINEYNKAINDGYSKSTLSGKGMVESSVDFADNEFIDTAKDFFRNNKSLMQSAPSNLPPTFYRDFMKKKHEDAVDSISSFLSGANTEPKRVKLLTELDDLRKEVAIFHSTTEEIFKQGKINLANLISKRNKELLKYNLELLKTDPNKEILKNLAASIQGINEQILEREVALMRLDPSDTRSVSEVINENLLKMKASMNDYQFSQVDYEKALERLKDYATTPGSSSAGGFDDMMPRDEYMKTFDTLTPTIDTPSTSNAFATLVDDLDDQIDDLMKFVATNNIEDSQAAFEYLQKRNAVVNRLEKAQAMAGDLSVSALGSFDDVNSYTASRWFAKQTDAAGNVLDTVDSVGEKAYLRMQSLFGDLEVLSKDFSKKFETLDTLAFDALTLEQRKIMKSTIPAIQDAFQKGVEVGIKTSKKISETTDYISSMNKALNKAMDAVMAIKPARFQDIAEKATMILDPVNAVIEYAIPKVTKGITKLVNKISSKMAPTAYDAVKYEDVADNVADAFKALQGAQKNVTKWKVGVQSTEDNIKRLQKAIADKKEQGKDVRDLQNALDEQLDKAKELRKNLDKADDLISAAKDTYKNSFGSVFDNTEKQLQQQLSRIESLDEATILTKQDEIGNIRKQLSQLQDVKEQFKDLSLSEKMDKLKDLKKTNRNLYKGLTKIMAKDSAKIVDKAIDSANAAESILGDTYVAYDKVKAAYSRAKRAGNLSQDILDKMGSMKDAVRIARRNAEAAKEALFIARKSRASFSTALKAGRYVLAAIKRALSTAKYALQGIKLLRYVARIIKTVISAAKLVMKAIEKIPYIGQIIEAVMFAVSVYFIVERKKTHDKTVEWNTEARSWRAEQELNPWAETPTGNKEWDKYHPWAIGALPRPLNMGYTDKLGFVDNVEDKQHHPFLGCHGGDYPKGKFTYPLISKEFNKDYKNYYSTEKYNVYKPESSLDYLDLIDPVAALGNFGVSGSPVVEEKRDEMWKSTSTLGLYLKHNVWTDEDATRKEDEYTYPVVNKDCYAFMGKYAPIAEKDPSKDYSSHTGLYEVSKKTREKWVEDGADPAVVEKLETREKDTYVAATTSSFEYDSLKGATDFFYDNNPEGFIITANNIPSYAIWENWREQGRRVEDTNYKQSVGEFVTRTYLQQNRDPKKAHPDNIDQYKFGDSPLTFKKVKEYTKEEFYKVVAKNYFKFDNDPKTYFLEGAFYKLNSSMPYNGMERSGVNPSKFRNFRYIYTKSGQEYINKKLNEILAYSTEQITRTLIDIKASIIKKLKYSHEFKERIKTIISFSNNGVKEEISPIGIERLLTALDEKEIINLLFDFDWDLHLDNFKYWQVKEKTVYNYFPGKGENVATTTFTNMAQLEFKDTRNTHPWDKLVAANMDDIIDHISSALYTGGNTMGLVNLTTILNNKTQIQVNAAVQKIWDDNHKIIETSTNIITKKAIEIAKSKYGIDIQNDPYNIIAYAAAKTIQLFGVLKQPEDVVLEKTLNIIISERLKYIMQDLRPPENIQQALLKANTVTKVHNVIKKFIDNASEKEKETNFYYLAQILLQTYNWNADNEDDILGGRTDFFKEMLRSTGLNKANATNDRVLVDRIIKRMKAEKLELSKAQYTLLHSTRDSLRIFVTDWVADYGIYQDVDTFIDNIKKYQNNQNYVDTFAVQYVNAQRFNRGGKTGFANQQWGNVNRVNDGSTYKYAAPGPTRLVALAKFYQKFDKDINKADIANRDLTKLYKVFMDFQEDTFEDSSLGQEALRRKYVDKTMGVVWDLLENKVFKKENFLLFDRSTKEGLKKHNKLKDSILTKLVPRWRDMMYESFFSNKTKLDSLFSIFDSSKTKDVDIRSYVHAEDENTFRSLFKGRDKKAIQNRVAYFDFIPDFLARVIDLGTVYPEIVKRLKEGKFKTSTTAISQVPILTAFGIILSEIRIAVKEAAEEQLRNVFENDTRLREMLESAGDKFFKNLTSNMTIAGNENPTNRSDFPYQIILTDPSENKIRLGRITDLKAENIISWVRAWFSNSTNKLRAQERKVALTKGISEASFQASFDVAREISKSVENYQVVRDYYKKVQEPTVQAMAKFYDEVVKPSKLPDALKPKDTAKLTSTEIKTLKAYFYIRNKIKYENAFKMTQNGFDPDIVVNNEYTLDDAEDLINNIGKVTASMRKFIIENLKDLGIKIEAPSQAELSKEKALKRTITITENQYLDTTYVEFINRFRNNALDQNDKINRIIDSLAVEELQNYRNNVLTKGTRSHILYFRKSDLSKSHIEYIWNTLSERDETRFRANLKTFIIHYTGRNIVSNSIVDLTVWQEIQGAWAKQVTKNLLDGLIDTSLTPFTQENVFDYIKNAFKGNFNSFMKKIYKIVAKDIQKYDPKFTFKGINAFNEIVKGIGRLNNEFNNLLLKKILAILGLEFTPNTIAKAQRILPLYIDTTDKNKQYKIMSDSIGRDLSPLTTIVNYVSDRNGNRIVPKESVASYTAAIDTRFRKYIEEAFQNYMAITANGKYYQIDREKIYKTILNYVAQGYSRYVIYNMKKSNLINVLNGTVFMENIKKHLTIGVLNKIFGNSVVKIADKIGDSTESSIDSNWQNYVKDVLLPNFVYKTLVAPSGAETPWFYTRVGIPAINLLIDKGIDNAINRFNSVQTADSDGKYYSVDKSTLTTTEVKNIASDLLFSSLNSFKDLLQKAYDENNSSLLPPVENYASYIVGKFYNDVNTPDKWRPALNNHKFSSMTKNIAATTDFTDLESLKPAEKAHFEYKALIALQRVLYSGAGELGSTKALEALYGNYMKYLQQFID